MTRALAWWHLAEQVAGRLTTPQIDAASADRDVQAAIRDSWLGAYSESLASKIHAAWLDSRCRLSVRALTGHWL